jgi:hypothetical protein
MRARRKEYRLYFVAGSSVEPRSQEYDFQQLTFRRRPAMDQSPSFESRDRQFFVSGWFRLLLAFTALSGVVAALQDQAESDLLFATLIVLGIVAIAALYLTILALEWIAAGFSANKLLSFVRYGRLLLLIILPVLLACFVAAMLRYSVIPIAANSQADWTIRYLVFDRFSGEVRIGKANDDDRDMKRRLPPKI